MRNATELSYNDMSPSLNLQTGGWRMHARDAEVPLGTDSHRTIPLLHALFPP